MTKLIIFTIVFVSFFIGNEAIGQNYTIDMGGSVSTCSGTFYDPGGASGAYGNNDAYTMTFCSDTPGDEIQFDFTLWDLEGCCDYLTIYDGPNTSSTQIYFGDGADPSPGTVQSTNGCLTFFWDSDGSVTYPGWAATISCYTPTCSDGIQNQGEVGIDCGGPCPTICTDFTIDMGGSVSTCSGTFYDPGGAGGSYGNNDSYTMTFCSDTPGDEIQFDFTLWDLEGCCDYLTIYDGPNTSSTQIYYGDGADPSPGTVQSTNGCLTFFWDSDGSVTYPGWAATISCSTPTCSDGIQNQGEAGIDCGGPCPTACPPIIIPTACSNNTYTLPASSSANFYDDGGPGGDCSTDGAAGNFANAGCLTTTTICAAPGEFLIADFSVFSMYNTSSGWDWMVIYEGSSTSGTVLFDNQSGSPDNPVGTDCTYDGSSLYFCAIGECLTFQFNATSVVNKEGWDALVSSVPFACTPLPVEILSFNAEKQGNSNELTWVTASEKNNDYFILEYSPNGKGWKEIQKIDGAGSTNNENTYFTTHRDFENGINYYRLTQVDYNGKKTKHGVISIDNSLDRTLLKRINTMGQEVNEDYNGIVILYYSDGTIEKTFQK